ncbi:hypothetical protein Asppvi_004283 [Aspergillus pseudoviridinutans]|uniref:Uncharacterized protein n=1 Tax=Aspergillus pseudoviridinutans TaxID=1517512 RepID=A0A9P3B643_9EURO|nr:uncharacterized protein Asppvi_004283 [Aspergillus pseudoviridinutans]GIJ85426.1 hypothetical protein Asppvi_004283 [Aspergillus pseudoviridinutans]
MVGDTPRQGSQLVETQEPEIDLFRKLNSYPFSTDVEFAKGLSIILGHPDIPATKAEIDCEDDLVVQAKCFYFSRKEQLSPPLDFKKFKTWLGSTPTAEPSPDAEICNYDSQRASVSETAVPPGLVSMNQQSPSVQEPAYPSSFSRIVELITTGQQIPGIQQIPDTVLTGHDTPSEKPRRRKPWEVDDEFARGSESAVEN